MTRRPLAAPALLVVVLLLAACGGASSPSPAATGTPAAPTSEQPTGTPVGEPTEAPTDTAGPLPSLPGIDLEEAARALEGVDSYRLAMTIEGDTSTSIEATVIRSPEPAQDLTLTAAGETTRIVIIGDQAWLSAGGAPLTPVPGQIAEQTAGSFDLLLLMSQFPEGFEQGMERVGTEDRNGVPATHFRVTGDSPAGQLASLPPGAQVDLWVAEAGYLVAIEGSGIDTGESTLQTFRLDVTNINDPSNAVEAPE